MSTKELIVSELDTLDEQDLNELYMIIKPFIEARRSTEPPSLMSKLRLIQIDAPPDFATNLDLYTSGEKNVG